MISRTIVLTDGRKFECDIIVADLVEFERHFDIDATMASARVEHWVFLCWAVCHRDGRFPGSYDEWVPLVKDFPIDENANGDSPKGEALSPVESPAP